MDNIDQPEIEENHRIHILSPFKLNFVSNIQNNEMNMFKCIFLIEPGIQWCSI